MATNLVEPVLRVNNDDVHTPMDELSVVADTRCTLSRLVFLDPSLHAGDSGTVLATAV